MGENGSTNSVVMVDNWITFLAKQEVAFQVMQLSLYWSSLWMRRLTTPSRQAKMQDDSVISSIATFHQQDDQAVGLAQLHGIGQRPKQLSVDLSTGQPMQPTQQMVKRRKCDSMSVTSEEEMVQSDTTRYFIVKTSTGSHTALEAAMSHSSGVWSFPTTTDRKLVSAVSSRQMVITIFSVASSGSFHGC